ncbi:MAG: antibiotic biosynthesis monooxygenase [Thermoflexales bacterium]|nr:antibiotic biosynthesis monooxygenase [Thermoflexales bacterium]
MAHIELAKYKLLPGVDPSALAQVEQQIQNEVGPKHPGYVGRELFHAADGSYVLLMRWADAQAASTWNNTLFASEAGRKLGSLVDPQSMSMEILTTAVP